MLSKKSFGGNKRNFLKLLMRFVRSDVRTTSLLRKTTTGRRIDTKEHRNGGVVQKSTFARFLASFDFRLFRQHRPKADHQADRRLAFGWFPTSAWREGNRGMERHERGQPLPKK